MVATWMSAPTLAAATRWSSKNQASRGSLTTIRSFSPNCSSSQSTSGPRAFGSLRQVVGQVPGLGPAVLDDDVDRGEEVVVVVDQPARLAEPPRVGPVGADLGLGDVDAEPTGETGEETGTAAPRAGHQQHLPAAWLRRGLVLHGWNSVTSRAG